MREGIANLQSLYESPGSSLSDGPPPLDVSCRTARQGRERRPFIGSEAPSYPLTADSHAIGRDNSSDVPSLRGDLARVPQGSASHRESPPVNAVVEGKLCSIPSDLAAELNEYVRGTCGLCCDVDHKRERRRSLADSVRQLEVEHEKSRANNAVTLLENKRRVHSLRNDLATIRQEIVL